MRHPRVRFIAYLLYRSSAQVCDGCYVHFPIHKTTLMVTGNIRRGAALPTHSAYFIQSTPELDVINSSSTFAASYQLELVLQTWYLMDRRRELKCSVREGCLIDMTITIMLSQRDANFYNFMNEPQTQNKIVETLQHLWMEKIKSK
ncbi:hypothetical protein BDR03DRAFT_1003571 [Suillus americanus]|nr:hypothetical protein BDR03DRAFT_1003571 [Suillus americanus]